VIRAGVDEVAAHSGRVIALNPGNPYPAKAWSDGYFVALADRLVGKGNRVVVIWGPGEREGASRIVAAAGNGVYLAPKLEIDEIGGFLKNVSALVTIDSGLKHVAVAVGVASVTLFGPTSPQEWHMGSRRDRYLSAELSCSPCRLLECPFGTPCMSRLTPDDVLRELSMIEGGVGVS
jgi:heptosyltransferase-2